MHNTSDQVFHCEACEEMKKLVDILYPGLVIKLISLATLSALTTSANVLLIYIACKTKSLVSNTRVFFISLCVAHLLGSMIVIPVWIVTRLNPDLATQLPSFCQAAAFVWVLMILASFYSLSALSLDRFFIISDPMRYPVSATTTKKLIVVSLLWILCALFASAPMMGWGEYVFMPDAIPLCGLNMKHSMSFTVVFIVVGHCVPLIVDIFCCGKIIGIARRQSVSIESRKNSSGSTSSIMSDLSSSSTTVIHPTVKLSKLKQKLNSLRLVFAGTGSFLVCWLPYLGAHIWMTTVRNIGHDSQSMPYILEFVVMCIGLLNGLVNPVVIMISNKDYRKRIKIIFRKLRILRAKESTSEDSREMDSSETNQRRSQRHKNMTEIFQSINIQSTCVTKEVQLDSKVDAIIESNDVELTQDNNGETCDESVSVTNEVVDTVKECTAPEVTCDDSVSTTDIVLNVRECRRLLSRTSMSSVDSVESFDEGANRNTNTWTAGGKGSYMEVPGLAVR